MDEAGAKAHAANITAPKEIEDLEKEIANATRCKQDAAKNQDFEAAARYRDEAEQLNEKLKAKKLEWEENLSANKQIVDEGKVAEVIAMMTGVPVQRIAQSESNRLLCMKEEIQGKVIGQDEAIDKIVRSIKRNRVGLKGFTYTGRTKE